MSDLVSLNGKKIKENIEILIQFHEIPVHSEF